MKERANTEERGAPYIKSVGKCNSLQERNISGNENRLQRIVEYSLTLSTAVSLLTFVAATKQKMDGESIVTSSVVACRQERTKKEASDM
jgi:hypothetical protein